MQLVLGWEQREHKSTKEIVFYSLGISWRRRKFLLRSLFFWHRYKLELIAVMGGAVLNFSL